MELQDKVALVTGAGSGIGKAAALLFAREGATVGVLSRTEDEIARTADEIRAAGGRAVVLPADISDAGAVSAAIDRLAADCGGLDIVFANAGINGLWAPIDELPPDAFDKTVAINLRGTYLTIHFAVPHLKRRGGGAIVVTSSINGTRTFSNGGATAYAVTKAGQLAMVQMLAPELGQHRIRINAICPGAIDTEIDDNTRQQDTEAARIQVDYPEGQIPLTGGASGTSAEVADLVLFLASDRARHITGTPVWIDGAQSLLI